MSNTTLPHSGTTYAIIDGNSLMHRAFHAVQSPMNAPDGRPTNAVFGFMAMFMKLVEDFAPDGIMVVFDKGKPQARIDMLPQYKAQRPPRDPALSAQFPMIRELLEAMRVPVFAVEGWEGDDLMGTLALQASQQGHNVLLVTGDRDSYQLVDDHTRIVINKKGMSEVAVLDADEVRKLYEGVGPEQICDFYGLKGDTSDNIPGVSGIGPKKAAALIVEYGSLDAVLDAADTIKGKLGENIRAHVQDALVSREVARIRRDAPVVFDAARARWPSFDPAEVRVAFDALALRSAKARVLKCADNELVSCGNSRDSLVGTVVASQLLEGSAAWDVLHTGVSEGLPLGVYYHADDEGFSLFETQATLWVGVSADRQSAPQVLVFREDEGLRALLYVYERGNAVSFSIKNDLRRLYPQDSSQACILDVAGIASDRCKDYFDVGLAAYLIDSEHGAYSPSELINQYLPGGMPSSDVDATHLNMLYAACLPTLKDRLLAEMETRGALRCYYDIEMPLIKVLSILERNGICIDIAVLRQQSLALSKRIEEIQDTIYETAGEEFNIDSPAQLSHVLFDVLGIPTRDPDSGRPLKKTKTGFYSTNAKLLESFAPSYPVIADILEYRERVKIRSTYLDALPRQILDDKRIHTTYNQNVTATGRLSSSDPNLQNIPVRSELGRMVRLAFVPRSKDNLMLSCDYSQIELRLLAHLSEDESLIEAFRSGQDFHRQTAAQIFGVKPADVTPLERSRAKAINFGIVYGQTAWGLSQALKISAAQAQDMIDRYYATYPGVRAYLDLQVKLAHEQGYVETMFGRRRYLHGLSSAAALRQFAERAAMNHPMQGSAADIIKLAMRRVQDKLHEEHFRAEMVVQVHDELVFDCPASELESLKTMVTNCMQNVVELKVPLLVSCAVGSTWAEAK